VIRAIETGTRLILEGDDVSLRTLIDATKYRPEGYFHSDKYQVYKMTNGEKGWDGWVRVLRKAGPGKAECLRGIQHRIFRAAEKKGIRVDRQSMLPRPFVDMVADDIPDDIVKASFKLDAYQKECVVAWLKHAIGINQVTVAGGKTVMLCTAAAMVKRTYPKAQFLYITPTERLVKQVYDEARKFLPGWDIGRYGGGQAKDARNSTAKDMVVCTQAILHRNYVKLAKEGFFKRFMCVLVDEVHHACSESMQNILLSVPAFFRFGASDTTKEDDEGKFAIIEGLVGPVYERIEAGSLIDRGRTAKPHIYIVDCPEWKDKYVQVPTKALPDTDAWFLNDGQWHRGVYTGPIYEYDELGKVKLRTEKVLKDQEDWADPSEPEYDKEKVPITVPGRHEILFEGQHYEIASSWCLLDRAYDRGIIQFKDRNNLIVEWVKYFAVERNLRTLVVATRTTHALILEGLIKKITDPAKVFLLLGEATTKERDETFEAYKKTPGAVLISPLVKEGVSINEIKAGVIADYVVSWEVARQLIGRFTRKKESENYAEIVWFIDRQHPVYRRNSLKLFDKLASIRGYTFYHPCQGPSSIPEAKRYEAD
jgi:superfamily II DNA or RNA helicase